MYSFESLTFFFLLQSKREAMMFYPTDPNEKFGLFALRLGKYKAHFYTRGTVGFTYIIFVEISQSSFIPRSDLRCFLAPASLCLCIRLQPQRYYPRPGLLSNCSPQGPRPPSSFWPGGRPLGALPPTFWGRPWPWSRVGENQENQGAVWVLHGVRREPDIKRDGPGPGALLQSHV